MKKGVRNDAFLNSHDLGQKGCEHKKSLSLLFKRQHYWKEFRAAIEQYILFSYYYRGNYF